MSSPSPLQDLGKRYLHTHGHHLTSQHSGSATTSSMTVDLFSVPIFFVVFRETLETAIIISLLLAFLKQTLDQKNQNHAVYRRHRWQVWIGAFIALFICFAIGAGLIGAYYASHKTSNSWSKVEYYWEGSFAILASIMITIMGIALLRVSKMQDKWADKLRKQDFGEKPKWYHRLGTNSPFFWVPLVTVLREGLEAVVFVTGVSFTSPPSAIGLSLVTGMAAGGLAGWLIYKFGAGSKLQIFLIISTCLLYLIAAGLFSRGVWYFEAQMWNNAVGSDAAELGAGPGSYDIAYSVWHVNFGNPEINGGGGWGIFNAILGWTNSATYGSVISYNLYWLLVIGMFACMRYKESKGHFPFMKSKPTVDEKLGETSETSSGILQRDSDEKLPEKNVQSVHVAPTRTISEETV